MEGARLAVGRWMVALQNIVCTFQLGPRFRFGLSPCVVVVVAAYVKLFKEGILYFVTKVERPNCFIITLLLLLLSWDRRYIFCLRSPMCFFFI